MPDRSIWRKDVAGWSLYDFANTIYSMNIVSLYLKRYIVEDLGHEDRLFDIPFSISMLLAAIVLPALGAFSDQSGKKKVFLLLFTLTCCIAVGGLSLVPAGAIAVIMVLFVIANFSYEAGQPFYNALLYSVADGRQARFVSGVGVAFGYVGSILGMVLVLPFVTGQIFGWDIPLLEAGGKEASFVPTAVLFALFAIPVFAWVKEKPAPRRESAGWKAAYRDVWNGLRLTRKYPGVLRFLVADYFIEDAVATVIVNMGLYCSIVIGLAEEQITAFLITSTVSAVIGSLLIGKLSQFWSLKRLIVGIVLGWVFALVAFVSTDSIAALYVLGSAVGILLGGLWTTTRPYLAELVPREELGRFFGLFSLSGRAAAVVGPLLWTAVVYSLDARRALGRWAAGTFGLRGEQVEHLPYQTAVLSLAMLMLVGLLILRKVPNSPEGRHA